MDLKKYPPKSKKYFREQTGDKNEILILAKHYIAITNNAI